MTRKRIFPRNAKFGATSASGVAFDILSGAGKALVKTITVRSQLSPDFTYDPWAEVPPDTKPNWMLTLAKPEITIQTHTGEPIVIAPYGTPTEQYGVPIAAGIGVFTLIGIFATGYFIWKAVAS